MSRPLTPKQARFCEEYLIDLNATQAAVRAGYSKKTANVIGPENLAKPCIASRIAEAQSERTGRTQITADYVLERLHQIESLDLTECFDENGHLLPINAMPEKFRCSIGGVDVSVFKTKVGEEITVEEFTKKLKIENRTKALELMGKHVNVKAFEKEGIELPEGVQFHIYLSDK